jgi:AcrR family transcriptional regulator
MAPRSEAVSSGFLPPQQRRSREALARLLHATLETLEASGLEGATIPRIARAARMAPASVYRRFRDRDALYRAAMIHALEAGAASNSETLRIESFKDRTLDGVVRGLVASTMQQYRTQPGIMRAVTRFIEQDSNEAFRVKALAVVAANFRRMVDLLLTFREDIRHPDPDRAITFALLTMATIIEVRELERVSMWHELLPLTDPELEEKVASMVIAHLRGSGPKTARGERPRRRR